MSEEAMEAMIGCAMSDHGILIETKVAPEMMSGKCAVIWSVMLELALSGVKPDFETLYIDKRLTECRELLMSVSDRFFSAANWQHYESDVIESWRVRKLATLGMILASPKGKSGELVNQVEKTLLELGRFIGGNDIVSLSSLLPGWIEQLTAKIKTAGTIPGVPWGFEKISTASLGGRPGQFVVIGARPSEGKSAIGVQMLRYQGMTLGVPTGLITIESSKEEVVTRFVSGGARVDSMKTALGYVGQSDKTNIAVFSKDAMEKAGNIFIYDRPGITLTEVRSACRRMVLNHGVKVIYVDYLQLIRVPNRKDKVAEILEVSNGLKEIARELKVCVVALAQLRRDDKRERPTMASIQWSSQIEQDADQIWLLWHKRAKDSNEIIESHVILEKIRDGVTCDVKVLFEKPFVSFMEVD